MAQIDVNKQNVMNAVKWIIRNQEAIIFGRQHELSFLSKDELEKIDYCIKTLESLKEAKQIYDFQKIS